MKQGNRILGKKRDHEPIRCQHFAWRLFERDGVFYADGRTNEPNLGKHSLNTRNRQQARDRLSKLDLSMAVKLGRAPAEPPESHSELSVAEGWERFLAHCDRPDVMGGVSAGTKKRYSKRRMNCVARGGRIVQR
jgi:hypothetical protein